MMNSKSKASQDAELLKDFVEAIERRAKELVDGETKGFTQLLNRKHRRSALLMLLPQSLRL